MESITLGQIVSWGGIIVALGGIIAYVLQPIKKLTARLDAIDRHLEDIDEKLNKDNRKLATNDEDSKIMFKGMLSLINHSIDNNHTGELKKTKEELENYIINRT